jgi:DNA-directed RNA polymerase subunit M/transcription elongation factor TFIIS
MKSCPVCKSEKIGHWMSKEFIFYNCYDCKHIWKEEVEK